MQPNQPSYLSLTLRTIVVHTITYSLVGALAFVLLRYEHLFAQPPLSAYMRRTDDPWVMAGPLFQPIRGALFGSVFYLLRDSLFGRRNGWLTMWWLLVALGVLSTFGPSPGSLEGMVFTRVPWRTHLAGLPEVIVQALLLAGALSFWVRRPEKRWLNGLLGALFALALLLPALGLLTRQGRPN